VQIPTLRDGETRLKFLLSKYTRECTSCSSSHWALFFLSKMLLEICKVCCKNESEIELMTSKTCLGRHPEILVRLNFKVMISKVHTRNQQLGVSVFVEEERSATNWYCSNCNNSQVTQVKDSSMKCIDANQPTTFVRVKTHIIHSITRKFSL